MAVNSSPEFYKENAFIQVTDSCGLGRVYRLDIYQIHNNGLTKRVSLTANQWMEQVALLEGSLKPFFTQPISAPSTLNIEIEGSELKLTSPGRPDIEPCLLKDPSSQKALGKAFADILNIRLVSYAPPPQSLAKQLPLEKPLQGKKTERPAPAHSDAPIKRRKLSSKNLPPIKNTPIAPPVGIENRGNDCFINAFFQAFVLTDPEFISRLKANPSIKAPGQKSTIQADEVNRFIERYLDSQRSNQTATGSDSIRAFLSQFKLEYEKGQHDPIEAFAPLFPDTPREMMKIYWNLDAESFEQKKDTYERDQDGYYSYSSIPFAPIPLNQFSERKSLQELVSAHLIDTSDFNSADGTIKGKKRVRSWESFPKKLPIVLHNTSNKPLKDVPLELQVSNASYELESFIRHIGSSHNSGHYVAYIKQGNRYYLCNDSYVQVIDEQKFFESAKNGRAFNYSLKS